MAKQGINTGSAPNDGTGDTLLSGGVKINSNFDEVYGKIGDGTNLYVGVVTHIQGGGTVSISSAYGAVTITGTANTANVNTDSLVVTGITLLGVTTATQLTNSNTLSTNTLSVVGVGTLGSAIIGSGTTITSGGVNAGVVTATYFHGDGSNLTNLKADPDWVSDSVGLHTTKGVAIGGTDPQGLPLSITGSAKATGVITATTFIGNLTGNVTGNASGSSGSCTGDAAGLSGTPNIAVGTIDGSSLKVTGITTTASFSATSATIGVSTVGVVTFNGSGSLDLGVSHADGTVGMVTAQYLQVGGNSGSDRLEVLRDGGIVVGGAATFKDDFKLDGASSKEVEWIQSSGNLNLTDGTYINFGDSQDVMTTYVSSAQDRFLINHRAQGSGDSNVEVQVDGTVVQIYKTGVNITGYCTATNFVSGKWTVGASGTTGWTFTGVGFTATAEDPDFYLARGNTYQYVVGAGHTFRIQSTQNGSTGTIWVDGITNNDTTSGTLTFTVPFNAPDTLYYQCTEHAGMGGTIFIYPALR